MSETSQNPSQDRQWEIFLKIAIALILLDLLINGFGAMAYEWLYKDNMTIRFDSFIMALFKRLEKIHRFLLFPLCRSITANTVHPAIHPLHP